ncbi:serine hydrolase [Candidatus Kaiserbacteria bacterium]|nr:serine hydrolase [Candidatus Kaiserbacteria bacterium]
MKYSAFTHNKLSFALACAVCFVAGAGMSYFGALFGPGNSPSVLRAGSEGYTYINPLLLCQNYEDGKFVAFAPFKTEAEHITATARDAGKIISGSVYIRDLTNGRWTGVNEDELYTPASLLKVPILIAYLKQAEKNPSILREQLYYVQQPGQKPPLIDDFILNSGNYYSIEELLRGMIIDSDNSAKDMLESRMDKDFLKDIYSELGMPNPYDAAGSYRISTRTYALFFRVLYNATLLSREMSEKAFQILAGVKFDKGLRAGTPADIPVAHKYGYSVLKRDPPRIIELSDCGILYIPDKPHLVCVMARGTDPEITATYIKDIALAANRFLANY